MRWRANPRRCLASALAVFALVALGGWVTILWVGAGWSNGPRVGGVGQVDLTGGAVVIARYYSESIARRVGAHIKPGTWVSAGGFHSPVWLYERTRFPARNTAFECIKIPLWPGVVG